MKKWIAQGRLVVRKAQPGMGKGLFAAAPIQKGEFIVEYKGRHLKTEEADQLRTRYLFEIDKHWTIDGSSHDNTARYINHSCKPNCEARIEEGKVMIYALYAIPEGEEITIDYGDEYFDEFIRPHGCRCNACAAEFRSRSQPTLSQTHPNRMR